MNKWGLMGLILVISLMAVFSVGSRTQSGHVVAPVVKDAVAKTQVTIDKEYGKMPLSFIPNRGQMDKQVYFYLQGKDKSVYFTSTGLTYALAGPAESQPDTESKSIQGFPVGQKEQREQRERELSQPSTRWVVKLDFVNARKNVKPECLEKSGTVISYFKGQAAEWQTGLKTASKIIYRQLWPGIDLVYYGTVNKMKYEFIVHPGADPAQIKLAYRGAENVKENSRGQLEVQTPMGGFFDDTPVAWQEIAGKREKVALKYALENENPLNPQDSYTYGFSVGEYNKNQTLILDPAVIVYCGYIGGSLTERGDGIAVDAAGCAYVTGWTYSAETTFPVAVGPDLSFNGGTWDAFVAKVKYDGTGLDYCGYIGGEGADYGQGIAVDASGCAYITGITDSTETNFPVTVGPDMNHNGGTDAFVTKVNADGTGLVYCGYIGGSNEDQGGVIAVDSSGCAYVIGNAYSTQTTFPVAGGPDLTHNGDRDVFVAKVMADGTGFVYCGYIGGFGDDCNDGIVVDALGCAYITGATTSTETSFPVIVGPDLTYGGGGADAFVAKVKADGSGLDYCGYIGGEGADYGHGIAMDALNCAYIIGETTSTETTLPMTVGPDLTHNGDYDVFVAKVNAAGTVLNYCGYIGGDAADRGYGIAVDASGCAYVAGYTLSNEISFPVIEGPDLTHNGFYDAFVAKVKADGTALYYCGYIAGSSDDRGYGIAIDNSGNAYVTGWTNSTEADFPVIGGPDLTHNGSSDVFVAKISNYETHSVNFTAGTGGTLTGITTQTVDHGGNCTAVEAVPDTGYQFVNWTGDGGFVTTTANPLTVTNVTANMTITANFTIDTYTVTFVPDSNGTLTGVTPQAVDYGNSCTAVEAVPNTGYHFVDWTGTNGFVTTTDNPLTVSNVTADMTITANFTIDTYTVTFVPDSNGTLTGDTPQSVNYGNSCTAVEAVPNTGYHFVNWTGTNGFVTTIDNPLAVANVTGDMTITANFALNPPLPIQLGAWNTTTPFNTPRSAHTSVVYNGYLYVLGGCDTNDTIHYNDVQYAPIDADGSLETWQVATPFNTGRRGHTSVAYNGYLYVMGGTPSGGGVLNDVQFAPINADGSLGSWQYTNSFNTGRLHFSSVVYNGYLYVIQGFYYSAAAPLTDVQVAAIDADGTLGPWQSTTTFTPGRWGHKSIAYNQYLYTMGGANWNGSYYTLGDVQYSSIDADGTLNAWQGTTALDPIRDSFGLVQYGGNLIMTGGFNISAYYDYVQYAATQADGTLGPWLRMTSFNTARGNHTSVVHNGYLYVIGGADNTGTAFADVQYAKINEQSPLTHAVTFVESTGGTISGSLYQVITDGEDCAQVTAVPDTGCVFVNWTGDGGFATTTDNPLTVANVTADMTITANFTIDTYTVTFVPGSNGTLTGVTPQAVNYGNSCTAVEAVPDAGYHFVNWTGTNGFVTTTDNPLTVTNVTANMTITANFTIDTYTVTFVPGSHGTLTGVTPQAVNYGNNCTAVEAVPNTGYHFVNWTGTNGFVTTTANPLTVSNVTADMTITANFLFINLAGRVTDSSGSGIANLNVNVYDLNQTFVKSGTTDSNGDYVVSDLTAGSYKVFFDGASAGNYLSEWYDDKGVFEQAYVLTLEIGQSLQGIDAQLTDGGIISGQVTNESSEGIENVLVVVRDLNQGWIDSAGTDANGNYSIQRLPGSYYKVNFNTNSAVGMYVSEWYNDKLRFNLADPIQVTAGVTTPLSVALEAGGNVAGRVINQAQAGIRNVQVMVKDLANLHRATAYTDANGNYLVVGLPLGDYKVYFNPNFFNFNYISEWYADKDSIKHGDIVTVALGNTTQADAELAPGSSISGTVTDESANPLEFVEVYVYDTGGQYYSGAYTDSSGHYQVNGLPAGNYKVNFYPYELDYYAVEWLGLPRNYNYRFEWYNDQAGFSTAGVVPVTLESPTTGIDAMLTENGGIISGRITDETGNGIAGCTVYTFLSKYDFGWYTSSGSAGSDAQGNYQVKGLPAGNYKVWFTPPGNSFYRNQFYNNILDVEQATPAAVFAGQTTAGIDAVLLKGGIVTGRVTDSNGKGIGNVLVRLPDAATNEYRGLIGNIAATDAQGYYIINAQAGTWKALFEANSAYGGYRSEYYNDTSVVENAASFTVNPEATVAGIDAVLTTGGGTLSGYVKNPAGTGLANAGIDVYDTQYNIAVASTSTDTTGYFEVPGLIPGTYKILASQYNVYPPEWYSDKTTYETADPILVTEGRTTPVTIILGGANPNLPNLSGRVTDYAGTGLEYVQVNLYDLNQEFVVSVSTDANGDYAFYNIPAGEYKLYSDAAAAGNYVSEWYQNTLSFEEAEPLTVTAGATLEHIDARLSAGSVVAGRITNETGQGIEAVWVMIRDRQGTWIAAVNSDAAGNYSVSRLLPGSYKVFFNTQNAVGLYVNEWYNDKENFNTADLVVVPAGETMTLDVTLAAGGAVSGTVTDGTSTPIENMAVEIYGPDGLYIAGAYTDSSGNWLVKGVPAGGYKVNFNPWELNYHGVDWYGLPRNYNYPFQWYNQKEGFVAADEVSVTVGNTTTAVDAVMNENEGGIISGRITASSGSGIAGGYACAFESFDNQLNWYYSEYYTGTGPDGNYEVKGLPTGNYIVLFFSPRGSLYKGEFYDNTRDRDLAARVAVTAAQTTSGIDAELEKGGVITGCVTDSQGNGLEGVWVRLMDAATNKYLGFLANNVQTGENGAYEVNVHPGQWKVMFQTYAMKAGGYVSEFYNNRPEVENANIVNVVAEEPILNIDAVLSPGGGKISGYVKDPANTGLRNAQVYVYDTQYQVFVGHTTTEGGGYFEVAGLIPGNYKIYTLYNDIYPSEWYSDQTSYETANALTVTAGGNTLVEVVLGGPDPLFPSLQITSPQGGESLMAGTVHEIAWTSLGANVNQVENVIISYSLDNGANWLDLVAGVANTGSYQWQVPGTPSENCLLQISFGDGDASISIISAAVFSIVSTLPTSVTLKSPNRWERLAVGSQQEITWISTGTTEVDKVALFYSMDGGVTWIPIISGIANTGSYTWTVPNTPAVHCLIRIQVGDADNCPSDVSTMEFSIELTSSPTITVTYPKGRETWKVGSIYTIQWNSTGTMTNVKLDYSVNNGSSWFSIATSTPNSGSYEWTVPDSPSGECLVRVSDTDGDPLDVSDGVFSILLAPSITLTSPNGAESWEAGSSQEITWTFTGVFGNIKIDYSTDGGSSWAVVEFSAANNGIFNWTVPDTPSENCLVRVSGTDVDEAPTDTSDGVFTIEAAPLLFVAAPNGGELWKAGDSYPITWTASNLEGNVVVDLYRGDSFDCNIGTTPAGDGRLEWNIPENFKNADDYRVLVYKDNTEDYSDTAFAITDRAPNHPDFNNDGHVDLIWRNRVSGGNEVWYMKGIRRLGTGNLPPMPGLDWNLVASADFNRDGKVDLLWRRAADGQNLVWYMDGITLKGSAALPPRPGVNWQIVGTGDFNGDGKVDLVWRHALNGRNQVWILNGVTVIAKLELAPRENLAWRIAGTGDFNNDGKVDLLWRNVKTGRNELWYMDGCVRIGTMVLHHQPRLNWQVVSTGDFNRDGHPDILWRRSTDGKGMVWYMDGVVIIGVENMEARPDLNWQIVGIGSYQN